MKNYLLQIKSLVLIVAIGLAMNSCSYTKSTGSASNFNKKHYNKGVVKYKASKKSNTAVLSQDIETEKLSRKDKKEEVKTQITQYIESKDLMASDGEAPVEYTKEAMIDKIKGNFTESKNLLTAKKEAATSAKEEKKIDKKIQRVERFENILAKMSLKMESKLTPDPDASPAAADKGLLGLLGGIFGIVGLTFSFLPIIGYLGLLLCISAIILGALGINGSNKGWAIAGIALGALGFILALTFVVLLAAILL